MNAPAEIKLHEHFVKAACPHDCPDTCAMLVKVVDGVAVKVSGNGDHGPTAGVLCTKVSRYAERTYHAERLLHPLRRTGPKGSGQFERIGWDEALDIITARLKPIAAQDPQQIVPYSYAGTMGLIQGEGMAQRFFHKLGASLLDRTICAEAGSVGYSYTLGPRIGVDLEQVQHAKLIIFWGANAIASSVHFWKRAQEAKRAGARLIAIDPYRSLTAEKCDLHIAPLPGTDSALALGLMHVLVRDNLLDHSYIASHTLGFEALSQRVAEFTPQRVAEICGISASEVELLAQEYGNTARSAATLIRVNYGVQRVKGGGMAVRNITCLPALVGAFRYAAGGVLLSTSGAFAVNDWGLKRPDLLAGRQPRMINMSTIGGDLLAAEPGIQALIVYNSNPVAVAPDSRKVAKGFARGDLFTVVLEHFLTDTADYADIVLPATTQLEHLDVIKPYGHYDVMVNNPAIAPLGESKPNSEIFRLLARRMGFTDACFDDTDEDLARIAINPGSPAGAGWDFDAARATGWWRVPTHAAGAAPFAEGGFDTPSGKVEFYSERAAAAGLDALPACIMPAEDTRSPLAQAYPLAMISPPARNFLNSTFVNVTSLRATEGEPWLELHPLDAAARGISEGEYVTVHNARGTLTLRARISTRARPGVVVALSIWWKKLASDGKNANELTSLTLTDMGRAPTFYDCLVQVSKPESLGV